MTVSSSSRTFMRPGCTGPLNVSRLLPFSMRTRSTHRRRRNSSSSVSSSESSCSRRPSRGVAPQATMAARASSAESNRSLISRSSVVVGMGMLSSGADYTTPCWRRSAEASRSGTIGVGVNRRSCEGRTKRKARFGSRPPRVSTAAGSGFTRGGLDPEAYLLPQRQERLLCPSVGADAPDEQEHRQSRCRSAAARA